ncbi:MAG: class I adenylate-forming enzyme family protein [Gammaproteobacteria bacterium]|nr:class I adenylate-forming enzyme family protein [Gammaproteobacteria bacterium]
MNNPKITTHSAAQRREYRAEGFWQDKTLFQSVQDQADKTPDRFAVRDRYRRLTYRQLVSAAEQLAMDLSENGVEPGQQVAVWLPNRLETVVGLMACSRNRYTCCPSLHRNHTVAEIMQILDRFHVAALISEKGYGTGAARCDVDAELARLRHTPVHYALQPFRRENAGSPLFGNSLKAQPSADIAALPAHPDPDTLVYLALTSGTTGAPKGVMHSDNTLLANARAIAADWHFSAASVIYTLSPLSHNLGFGAMVTALYSGAEAVLSQLAPGESLVDDLLRTGATFIYGVPAHAVDLLMELKEPGKEAPENITGFRISGAQVPGNVAAELLEYGIKPQTGYGMTEAHSHNYTLPDAAPERITGTAGRACPGYQLKIWSLDNKDVELGAGEIGQIGGKGASLMLGYFEDDTATAGSLNSDGWFMTGDLGSLDGDGYLHIEGRIKDVIIRGGHNIYPARIEQLAARHPDIDKVAAIPFPDERLGEKVCLVIKPVNGANPDPEQILRHLNAEGLSKYDMPEYLVEIDDMPMTPGGKVKKRALLALISAGRVNPQPVRS